MSNATDLSGGVHPVSDEELKKHPSSPRSILDPLPLPTAAELHDIALAQQGDKQKRDVLLEPLRQDVQKLAAHYSDYYRVDAGELERAGEAVLQQALADFTPELKREFGFYARSRIAGAIVDAAKVNQKDN